MDPSAEIKDIALDFVFQYVEKSEPIYRSQVDDVSDGPDHNDIQSYELKLCDLGIDGVMISLSHPIEQTAYIILPSEKVTELAEYLKKTLCQHMPSSQHRIFRADRGRVPLSGPKLPRGV